jgi:hypothetical protein
MEKAKIIHRTEEEEATSKAAALYATLQRNQTT